MFGPGGSPGVASQMMSVYRKLGVSSRSQAIKRVQEIGLLGR
jgi:DNA-binding CsgD family transcriptional regulator